MYYVYILKLNNGKLYKGYTNNLNRRIIEHKGNKVKSTRYKLPKLVHYECYFFKSDAERRERYLKTTEGRRFLKQQIRDLINSMEGCLSG